jgi:hypothetical protein
VTALSKISNHDLELKTLQDNLEQTLATRLGMKARRPRQANKKGTVKPNGKGAENYTVFSWPLGKTCHSDSGPYGPVIQKIAVVTHKLKISYWPCTYRNYCAR